MLEVGKGGDRNMRNHVEKVWRESLKRDDRKHHHVGHVSVMWKPGTKKTPKNPEG